MSAASSIFCPFTIQTYFSTPPHSTTDTATADEHPNYTYTVHPETPWLAMNHFRQFEYKDQTHRLHSTILLRYHTSPKATGSSATTPTLPTYRIAHILEIRAHDPAHVYIRVFFFNSPSAIQQHSSPEDLAVETDARAQLGENGHSNGQDWGVLQGTELIATNEMAIVTPECIVCGVDVVRRPVMVDGGIKILSGGVIASARRVDRGVRDQDMENDDDEGGGRGDNAAEDEEGGEEARLARQTYFWTRKWDVHSRAFLSGDG